MAHGKLRYIKPGSHSAGERLKKALAYAANKEKTDGGLWVSALNCSLAGDKSPALNVYDQMIETKRAWGTMDGRQGYDLILSFRAEEKDKAKCFEVLQSAAQELFGDRYETMICMHTNTNYLHGHITINSVSFVDGKKFRYEPGDWERRFQPVIDKYALQAGYSADRTGEEKTQAKSGRKDACIQNWTIINQSDIDKAVNQSKSYEEFEAAMRSMGYCMDYGKQSGKTCLKIRKADSGQDRYRRCTEKTLGYAYTLEGIRERIASKGKAYPEIAVSAVPVAVRFHYDIRHKKRAFRKWEELSPVERFQLRQFLKYRKLGRTQYRINWKVVGKYRRLAADSLRKRDLLIKYGIDSYGGFSGAIQEIRRKEKLCYEKQNELQHREAVFLKETELYRKIEACMAEGNIRDAEELAKKLKEECGHSVEETGEFIRKLSERKKNLKREAAIYKREQKKLEEIRKEFARTYGLPEEQRESESCTKEEKERKPDRKNNLQKK